MEAPASSSVLAAESLEDKLAANKIASENAAAKKAANKRTKISAATSEATPITEETSLPDSISSSFYLPDTRLSLDDLRALFGISDTDVLNVLRLRNEHDAEIRHPRTGQVMEAASDDYPRWDPKDCRLAILISCCPELVQLPATPIARPAPATDLTVPLQDLAQSFTTVQGDIKVLKETMLELKKAMATPAKTTTFADVTGKQLTTIVQQAAKSAATAAVTQNAVQQRQRNMALWAWSSSPWPPCTTNASCWEHVVCSSLPTSASTRTTHRLN
eukprot:jgi/Mesvir1/19264/Mv10344-RA.1